MNLVEAFAHSVALYPQKVALFWGDSEFTYTTLQDQAQRVGAALATGFGVKPGDRVGLWLKNRPEFIPALLGILHADAVVVPINNFLKPAEVNFILADADIDVLITDEELGAHTATLSALRPGLKVCQIESAVTFSGLSEKQRANELARPLTPALSHDEGEGGAKPGAGERAPGDGARSHISKALPANIQTASASSNRSESDLAMIIYTSGTTGKPKGAMLSHGNLLHNVESCRQVLATVDVDRFAVLLPLFHTYMLTVGLLLPLIHGASIVLIKSLHQPHHMLQEMIQRQASVLPAIPQFYRTLAHAPLPVKLPFRLCISGSAPLPVSVLKAFEAKHGIPLIEGYGLSEASPVVTKNPIRGVRKPGSVGLPIPNVEVSVQDDAGQMLGVGEIGEICVRGGNVMLGYWNQPEETAKVMRAGWLLTGDVGYRDADGYYYITDRKKDMLLVNGINVYPREVEEVIYHFPGVKEAAVIGVPDPRRGEQPVAFVAAAEGANLDEKALLQFVKENLADYKVPRRVVFLPGLPRNATGKILKTTLREQAET